MPPSRAVFDSALAALLAAPGELPARELLAPFEDEASEAVEGLRALGVPVAASRPRASIEAELEVLGGLSRLLERLLLAFQPAPTRPLGPVHPLSSDELVDWMKTLGFRIPERFFYHPFFHEVLEVQVAEDPELQPRLLETRWPCFMLDRLLILRGGVTVGAGRQAMDPELVARSPMHFTGLRATRETRDAGCFRRDYLTPGAYVYNADGVHLIEPGMAPSGPMAEAGWQNPERIELLRYRCMVTTRREVLRVDPSQDRFVEVR